MHLGIQASKYVCDIVYSHDSAGESPVPNVMSYYTILRTLSRPLTGDQAMDQLKSQMSWVIEQPILTHGDIGFTGFAHVHGTRPSPDSYDPTSIFGSVVGSPQRFTVQPPRL